MTDPAEQIETQEETPSPRIGAIPSATPAARETIDADLRNFVWTVLRGKWIVLAVTVLAVVYAGYSVTKFAPQYRAEIVVAPIQFESGLKLPSGLGQFAAGIGFELGSPRVSRFDQLRRLLGSVVLADRIDRKYGYVMKIFGGAWDAKTESWIPPDNFRADVDAFFRRFANVPEWTPPSTQTLAQFARNAIQMTPLDKTPGIFRISFSSSDRDFALSFLTRYYEEAEALLRENEIQQVTAQIEYIRTKLGQTTVADYRAALIQVLAEQEKKMMILKSGLPYVANVIEPPTVSDAPSRPNIMMRLILGLVGGLILGVLAVLLISFLRSILKRPARAA